MVGERSSPRRKEVIPRHDRRPKEIPGPCQADGSPGGRGRGGRLVVDARRLAAGFLLAGASAAGLAVGGAVQAVPAAATTAAETSASTLYKDALATTRAWSVHYD